MTDYYPGLNEPIKPLKLPMGDHQYYDEHAPAFRRDNPSEEGQLYLDTKINFLNEIMKFLPRATTNTLTEHNYNEKGIDSLSDKADIAESVYNKTVFEDKETGLWKGNQSTILDQLFSDKQSKINMNNTAAGNINISRFAGLLGIPFDGKIALGTYNVKDEDNNVREVTFKEEVGEDKKGLGKYFFEYTNRKGQAIKYDITGLNSNYLAPILKDLKGDDYARNFREGVNFHATVVDMQHTNASYDNSSNQFVVDANGDGYADTNGEGENIEYDSLSTTSLDTSLYQSAYLKELGVYFPVLDYSDAFSDFMSGSLFGTDAIDKKYTDMDRKTYNKLHSALDPNNTTGEFESFLNKIKIKVSGLEGNHEAAYIPNIYELARKGIDFSQPAADDTKWEDKDVFNMSMMMLESRRRYTYAMSTIFGIQDSDPDIKDAVSKYTNPDIWQCDTTEDYLYMDVQTVAGRYERMYNYFIPKDVGKIITDPVDRKIEKLNWLNKRAIEYTTNQAMFTLYQDSLNRALKENKLELPNLLIDDSFVDENNKRPKCLDDLNSMLRKVSASVESGSQINETNLAQLLSLVKEAKDWMISKVADADRATVLTGSYPGRDGTAYKKDNQEKIYYVTNPVGNEATKWIQLNDFITKIKKSAGDMLVIKDETANSKNFIIDYLDTRTDIASTVLYKKATDGSIEEDDSYRQRVVSNAIETMSHYYKNYTSNVDNYGSAKASAEMEKIIDMSFQVSNNTGDMFSILTDTVNDQARMFNDINMIDKFHYIQYGTVRNVAGVKQNGETTTENLYEKGILDLGYYPAEIARTTAESPYVSSKQIPDSDQFMDGVDSARYEVNMVDKMYFSMIAEMQKMNNFYMMMSFASPVDANNDGLINEADKESTEPFSWTGQQATFSGVTYSVDKYNRLYTPLLNAERKPVTVRNVAMGATDSYQAVPAPDEQNIYTIYQFLDAYPTKTVQLNTANQFNKLLHDVVGVSDFTATDGATNWKSSIKKVTGGYDVQLKYQNGTSITGYRVKLDASGKDIGISQADIALQSLDSEVTKSVDVGLYRTSNLQGLIGSEESDYYDSVFSYLDANRDGVNAENVAVAGAVVNVPNIGIANRFLNIAPLQSDNPVLDGVAPAFDAQFNNNTLWKIDIKKSTSGDTNDVHVKYTDGVQAKGYIVRIGRDGKDVGKSKIENLANLSSMCSVDVFSYQEPHYKAVNNGFFADCNKLYKDGASSPLLAQVDALADGEFVSLDNHELFKKLYAITGNNDFVATVANQTDWSLVIKKKTILDPVPTPDNNNYLGAYDVTIRWKGAVDGIKGLTVRVDASGKDVGYSSIGNITSLDPTDLGSAVNLISMTEYPATVITNNLITTHPKVFQSALENPGVKDNSGLRRINDVDTINKLLAAGRVYNFRAIAAVEADEAAGVVGVPGNTDKYQVDVVRNNNVYEIHVKYNDSLAAKPTYKGFIIEVNDSGADVGSTRFSEDLNSLNAYCTKNIHNYEVVKLGNGMADVVDVNYFKDIFANLDLTPTNVINISNPVVINSLIGMTSDNFVARLANTASWNASITGVGVGKYDITVNIDVDAVAPDVPKQFVVRVNDTGKDIGFKNIGSTAPLVEYITQSMPNGFIDDTAIKTDYNAMFQYLANNATAEIPIDNAVIFNKLISTTGAPFAATVANKANWKATIKKSGQAGEFDVSLAYKTGNNWEGCIVRVNSNGVDIGFSPIEGLDQGVTPAPYVNTVNEGYESKLNDSLRMTVKAVMGWNTYDVFSDGSFVTIAKDNGVVIDATEYAVSAGMPLVDVDATVARIGVITDVSKAQKAFQNAGLTYVPTSANSTDWSIDVSEYGNNYLYELTYNKNTAPKVKSILADANGSILGYFGTSTASTETSIKSSMEYKFNFLDPLKSSYDALLEDRKAYLQSTSIFGNDSTEDILGIGLVTKNGIATAMDTMADNIYQDIANQLFGSVFEDEIIADEDGNDCYKIKTPPAVASTMGLTSPYDILDAKLTGWLDGKTAGGLVKVETFKNYISVYANQLLIDKLKDNNIIDAVGSLQIVSETDTVSQMLSKIDSLVLEGTFSQLFKSQVASVKQGLKDVVTGAEYPILNGEGKEEITSDKRNFVSDIIAKSVKEDYEHIKTFVSSLYNKMSAIDFADSGTNNASVSTTQFNMLDFTNNDTITPIWMDDFGEFTITSSEINDSILEKVLLTEGILVNKKDTSGNNIDNQYEILQGINPSLGIPSFDILTREGYKNSAGDVTIYTKDQIYGASGLISRINNKLFGNELSAWVNGVVNINYTAFGNKNLKVNTKDSLIAMFISPDFVQTVRQVKAYKEAEGFKWVDSSIPANPANSDYFFIDDELGVLWDFVKKNVPSEVAGITLPPLLTTGTKGGVISYKDFDIIEKISDIIENKWSIQDDDTWESQNGVDYAKAVTNNSTFKTKAQADFAVMANNISAAFNSVGGGSSSSINFNPELAAAIRQISANYGFTFKVSYSANYRKGDSVVTSTFVRNEPSSGLTVSGGTASVSHTAQGYTFPTEKYFGKDKYTKVEGSERTVIAFSACNFNGTITSGGELTSFQNVWATGNWGGNLQRTNYGYLENSNTVQQEYERDFLKSENTSEWLALSDYSGDGSEDGQLTVYDALLLLRDRAKSNMGYLKIQTDRYNDYAKQVKEMLAIGSANSTLESLFRDEFYMRNGFDSLIMGAEFQSRFVENAFVSTDGEIASKADTLSMTKSVGWYETGGRVVKNSTSSEIDNKMDFSKFDYDMETGNVNQHATVKAKVSEMKYDESQGKDNIRSTLERAMRDEFGRTLVFGDLMLSTSGQNVKSFQGNDVSISVHSKNGDGVKLDESSLFGALKVMRVINYDRGDIAVQDQVIQLKSSKVADMTYDEFSKQVKFLKDVFSPNDEAKVRQFYDFFHNIGWNNVSVGANASSAHSLIELNSIYMEVLLARIMISIANDELNLEYDRRKADYDEQLAKKKDEEVSAQIADSKRSQFKSYLKSISKK